MAGRFPRSLTWAALAAPVFFLLAAGDLALRSRGALLRAEKYERWRNNPALKAEYLSAEYGGQASEKEFQSSQSSAKLAYIWYKTAAQEFPSPLNPWAARASARLPGALAAWKAELAGQGVNAQPWMTE